MGLRAVGLELQGRAEFGLGFGRFAPAQQGGAEVVVGPGVVGLELQRRAALGLGLGRLALGHRVMPRS